MSVVKQHNEIVNTPDFGDQVAFTVGMSYVTGFLLGLGKGVYKGLPKSSKLPRRIKISNMFNSIGTETSRAGNAFGAAGFLYFLVGKTLNIFLEDQLDYLSPIQKNMVCGAATGALFKSTLGMVPTAFGAVIGAGIAGAFHLITEAGNKSGLIGFEMKF